MPQKASPTIGDMQQKKIWVSKYKHAVCQFSEHSVDSQFTRSTNMSPGKGKPILN